MEHHCAWGLCDSDSRYQDPDNPVTFVSFPDPIFNRERAKTWARLCGRVGFTVKNITLETKICSRHFSTSEVLNPLLNPVLQPFPALPEDERRYQRKNKPKSSQAASSSTLTSSWKVYSNKKKSHSAIPVHVPVLIRDSTPTKLDVKETSSTPLKLKLLPGMLIFKYFPSIPFNNYQIIS